MANLSAFETLAPYKAADGWRWRWRAADSLTPAEAVAVGDPQAAERRWRAAGQLAAGAAEYSFELSAAAKAAGQVGPADVGGGSVSWNEWAGTYVFLG